jgi:hypothetical protein
MIPWFSLRDMFGLLTTVCAIAALAHGGLYYSEPYGGLCRLGMIIFGVILLAASCIAAVKRYFLQRIELR